MIEVKLADRDEAITGYGVILSERAEDVPAIDALARLYESAEQHSNLLDMLERRLPLTDEVPDRVQLRLKMAGLLEGALRRTDAALEAYREVLVDDARSQVAREGLERMLDDDSLRLRAAEVLEPIYTLLGDTRALERLSELFATYLADVHERARRFNCPKVAAGGSPTQDLLLHVTFVTI